MVEKYIKIHIKTNIVVALICAIIVFIPLFIVSLTYDVISYDLFIAFVPFPIALVWVLVSALSIIRFRKMILRQESLYGTTFSDVNATQLETKLYLCDEWLIWAGECAIHKKHIKSLKYRPVFGRVGSSNKVTIKTVDGKRYIIWCRSASNIQKIRAWRKA